MRKLEMSPVDLQKMKYGEQNQGDYLVKRKSQSPSRHIAAQQNAPPAYMGPPIYPQSQGAPPNYYAFEGGEYSQL